MAEKTDAQVNIGGKTYTLSGYESEEYILKVADYLNTKIRELNDDADYGKMPQDMRQILLNLNIAEDYFKEMEKNEELQRVIDKKDNDLYDIKHELVAAQMKLESALKSAADPEKDAADAKKSAADQKKEAAEPKKNTADAKKSAADQKKKKNV